MSELTFENLNFSFLLDIENKIGYLQEWRNGNWSEAERFPLPQQLDGLHKQSMLARAIRDFRGEGIYHALCSALGVTPAAQQPGWLDRLHSGSRVVAARIAEIIYA
jgi:hypothetical protein